jgi:iron complex transport system substrate-binding protein
MKKKLLLVLSLMLVMSIFLTGCRAAAVSAKTGKTFVFTDSIGRKVELPSHLTRISPSGAIAAMILYAAAPEKLVSICRQPDEAYKKYYTKEYLRLPSTGQIYGIADINLEELINLSPQVIIDLGDIKKDMAADLDAFQQQTGIPVVFIEATTSTYPKAFRTLSTLLGEDEHGEAMAKFTEETMALAEKARTQITGKNRLRVMFGTGESGLDCNAKGSIHSSVLETVGVENAIAVPEISTKAAVTKLQWKKS